MSKDRDNEIVKRCRSGDRAAFEQLVLKYQRPVFNAAFRILGNREDARDIVQTVFLKVYEGLDQYDSHYRFFSWLYRITVNESLNALRRPSREQPLSGREQAPVRANPARLADEAEIGVRIQDALQQLKSEDRVVLTLRHFLECSYRDIGEVLDIPEKTVKSRLYSARQRLRDQLLARDGLKSK